jgi:hypothetical protein
MATTTSPGQVTPDLGPNVLHPHVDSVTLTDSAFNSTAVIPAGASFFLRVDMGVNGPLAVLWPGAWNAKIFLHRIDAAGVVALPVIGFAWPGVAVTTVPLGPFVAGGAAIPAGIYHIAIDLDPAAPAVAAVVSAFIDGPTVEIMP